MLIFCAGEATAMTDILYFVYFWTTHHPIAVAVTVAVFIVLTWLLNRKSTLDRENDRVVKNLVNGAKDKYKDVRPLR
jgi:type II secretory pathway component PulF